MIKNIFRLVLLFPFKFLLYIANLYSKVLKYIDPNGSERYWEELTQKNINSKINSTLRFKNHGKIFNLNSNFVKKLKYFTPNKITSYRVYTLLTKEKDTVNWLDKNGGKETFFFDVGANIALYSIYYSKKFKAKSICFEPNFLNNNLIQKNISINGLEKYITIVPNPLFSQNKFGVFSQNSELAGMAESTFNQKKFKNNYKILALSLDNLLKNFKLKKKSCILKIDVDGNEYEVIKGSKKFLKYFCKSALLEVSAKSKDKINLLMKSFGFKKKNEVKREFTSDEFWYK